MRGLREMFYSNPLSPNRFGTVVPQPSKEESNEGFFRALMDAYTEAWNREDIDAIESFYNVPFFSYHDGAVHVYSDANLSRAITAEWIEVNRREGPAVWERLSFSLERQGHNSVLVTSRWVFRRPDGTAVWDVVDSYHLCRFGEEWKFLDRTIHE
jgi:hypothetical protein